MGRLKYIRKLLLWTVLLIPIATRTQFIKVTALSNSPSTEKKNKGNEISRRQVWVAGLGAVTAVGYGKLMGNVVIPRIFQGPLEYPQQHNQRVSSTIQEALVLAASSMVSNPSHVSTPLTASTLDRPLRVLEVGMGADCRLIRSGLYNLAFETLAKNGVSRVELVGMDLVRPKQDSIEKARDYLNQFSSRPDLDSAALDIKLTVFEQDILQPFPIGSEWPPFDAVICCLTLCSVTDQDLAVTRLRDSIRPHGGCLGYIEHVAVNPSETGHKFLEWQQTTLDPLQQALADNCHLHRYSEQTIDSVFGIAQGNAKLITEERFFVDSMWPVSCQACGVVQRTEKWV